MKTMGYSLRMCKKIKGILPKTCEIARSNLKMELGKMKLVYGLKYEHRELSPADNVLLFACFLMFWTGYRVY